MSQEWAAHIQEEILPSLTEHTDLGEDMLEIGPGPGAATEWLRHRVKRLTALEVEPAAAATLADTYAGSNVEVVIGDAAELGYPDESFDSVGTFTMLHHVPTLARWLSAWSTPASGAPGSCAARQLITRVMTRATG